MRRLVGILAVAVSLLAASFVCHGIRLDSIGIRVALPLGDRPRFAGFEVGWQVSIGWISAALLVGSDGSTLIEGSGHLSLWGSGGPFTTRVSVSAAVAFLDPSSILPAVSAGGGLGVRYATGGGPWGDARIELLYPLAFVPPLITVGGGWSL